MRRGDHNAVIHQPSRPFDGARSVDRGLHGGDLAGEGNERFPAKPAPEAHLHQPHVGGLGGRIGCQITMAPDDLARIVPLAYADLTA